MNRGDNMFSMENETMLIEDREDLIGILRMRYGSISGELIEKIYNINDNNTIERLILVAANAPTFEIFIEELKEGDGAFKITGERFNPNSKGDGEMF